MKRSRKLDSEEIDTANIATARKTSIEKIQNIHMPFKLILIAFLSASRVLLVTLAWYIEMGIYSATRSAGTTAQHYSAESWRHHSAQ